MGEIGSELAEILGKLTADQLRYVAARVKCNSDREACRMARVSESTLYRWKQRGVPVDEAVRLVALDGVALARAQLERASVEAVEVLLDDLRARRHSKIRQDAARDILDRAGMRGVRQVDVTSGGQPLVVNVVPRNEDD